MIDGTYAVEYDTPLGHKLGMVTLRTEGKKAFADIDAPIVGKRTMKGEADGDKFTAHGAGKLKIVGEIEFTIEGQVFGDDLHVVIHSNKGEYDIVGVRL